MISICIIPALLAACQAAVDRLIEGEDPAASVLSEAPPPPRPEFELRATNAVAGQTFTLTAIGVPPGAPVQFVVTKAGLGWGRCFAPQKCTSVKTPSVVLPPVNADARGVAVYNYGVAQLLAGSWISAQAVVGSYPNFRFSNTIDRKVGPTGTVISVGVDSDGDGFTVNQGDCAEFDVRINPITSDRIGDLHDQNCDDVDGVDADGDHVAAGTTAGLDCDDTDPTVYSFAPEICDGLDNNCDGAMPQIGTYAALGGGFLNQMHDTYAIHYEVTQDIRIEHLRFMGGTTGPWSTVLRVYESTAPGQPYNLVRTFPTAVVDQPAGWFKHADIRMPLWNGHRYVFEIEAIGQVAIWRASQPTPAVPYGWGTLTSTWTTTSLLTDGAITLPANNDTLQMQLQSILEVDQDGDGEVACRDCDDHDPNVGVCPS